MMLEQVLNSVSCCCIIAQGVAMEYNRVYYNTLV
jgi:hypothetical protein